MPTLPRYGFPTAPVAIRQRLFAEIARGRRPVIAERTHAAAGAVATREDGAAGSRPDADLLAQTLDRLPRLRGTDPAVDVLPGGLTNRSYKVVAPGRRPVVVRISAGKSSLLSIDRQAECHNALAAAHTGVAPALLLCDPYQGVSAVDWIEGRTLTEADLDDEATLGRVAMLCRRLHSGRRFLGDFDMFAIQRRYLDVVRERGFRLPEDYAEYADRVQTVRRALAVQPSRTVPCHNDLLAANIIDDGQRVWFIDYEYAGNNDPCFELGNIWSEASLPVDRLEHLVGVYFGLHSPAKVARARLFALMSKYGWTLWAAIQDAVSEVDFDFWAWGMDKYQRAVAEFTGSDFARLIDEVQQPI
jgi:thiamine kinase-like enzyme